MKYSQAVLLAYIGASAIAVNAFPRGYRHSMEDRDLSEIQFKREVDFDFEDLFTRGPEPAPGSEFVAPPLRKARRLRPADFSRDLDEMDDLSSRDYDLEADLVARWFNNFRQNYREAKSQRLQRQSAKATAKAAGGSGSGGGDPSGGDASGPSRRDLLAEDDFFEARDLMDEDDIFEARDLSEDEFFEARDLMDEDAIFEARDLSEDEFFEARDLMAEDDIFEARDLVAEDEMLEARNLKDMWNGMRSQRKKNKTQRLQEQSNLAAGKAAAATAGQAAGSDPSASGQ